MFLLFEMNVASGQDIENTNPSGIPEEKIVYDIPEWYPDLTGSKDDDEGHGGPKNQFIRTQDDTFERQNLLTGKPIENTESVVGFIYAYAGIGFIALIVGFPMIKKNQQQEQNRFQEIKKEQEEFSTQKTILISFW